MSIKDQIAEMEAEEFTDAKILQLTGYTKQRLEELRQEPGYKDLVDSFKVRAPIEVTENRYKRIEDRALEALESQLPFAEAAVLLKTLEVVHKRQDLKNPRQAPAQIQIVSIMLPTHQIPAQNEKIMYNADGEIIAVGDRSFASLPSPDVRQLFSTIEAQIQQQKEVTPSLAGSLTPEDI